MKVIVQKLYKKVPSDIEKAIKYYSILSIVDNLNLTHKQVELLAFTSVRGTITSPSARKEFVEMFDSSLQSLENIKSKLKKKGWLVEVDHKYRVNPRVNLDFSRDIILQIGLHGTDTTKQTEKRVDKDDSREDGDASRDSREDNRIPVQGFA